MTANNAQIARAVPLSVTGGKLLTGTAQPMGELLVDAGRLGAESADHILMRQREIGLRFGEVGRALGLLTDDDVRFALSAQFQYSYLTPESNLSRELVAAYQPGSPVVEQLRMLRSQLMLRWFANGQDRKGLAIVSPGAQEGRSYLAANLAIVFSQLGERTLLIDADLRSPRQHQLFHLGKRVGLSEVLAGRASAAEAVASIETLSHLSVLAAGTLAPNPQELLGRQGFSRLLQSLGEDFDVVIIDTPPAMACADAHTVAVRAGAALMVARQDHSSMVQMTRFTRSLREFGVMLVGSVLNDAR